MSRNRCRCVRLPVVRVQDSSDLPQLPDEIIEIIVSKVLPTEVSFSYHTSFVYFFQFEK